LWALHLRHLQYMPAVWIVSNTRISRHRVVPETEVCVSARRPCSGSI
jgi:hypothetical protein